MLGTGIKIIVEIVAESVFSVSIRLMCMSAVADNSLYSVAFKKVRDPCAMIACVQSHIHRQFPKSPPDLFEDPGHGCDIIYIRRLYMHIHDYIMQAVHCSMVTVIESIRLSIP